MLVLLCMPKFLHNYNHQLKDAPLRMLARHLKNELRLAWPCSTPAVRSSWITPWLRKATGKHH